MKILTHLNLSQNELQNAVLHKLTEAPSNPKLGQIYFNSAENKAYIYLASGWENLGLSDALVTKLQGIEEGADKVLYGTLPDAAANSGKVVIYTGATTENYTTGLVYVSDGTTWNEATPTISGVDTETAETDVVNGVISTNVRISEDATNAIQIKTVDGVTGLYVEATEVSAATVDEDGLMTSDDKAKLDAIAEGAEANVLNGVQVNGTELTITDKKVNVELAAADNSLEVATDAAGKITVGAKISATEGNSLSIEADGLYVAVPEIDVPEYIVVKAATATEGAIATYNLTKDGVVVGANIDIPKDFLVKSADIAEVTEADVPYTGAKVGDKYIDFVVNVKEGSAEEQHIYLPVNELVDVYTAGNGIEISATDVVSVKVVAENGLSVDADGIKLAAATETTAGAMSAEDKAKLNAVAAGAQVNVIEGVQVNGVDLTIDENKKVNVTMENATTEADGLMSKEDKAALDAAVAANTQQDKDIDAIEAKNTTQDEAIQANAEAIAALETANTGIAEDIAALEAKDTELTEAIAANTAAIEGKQDKLTAGTYMEITDENVINANIPTASESAAGLIKLGTGLAIDESGVVSVTGAAEASSVAWANVTGKPSTLGTENVTAGTYSKVTVDKYGLVTEGAQLEAADIPDLSATYIKQTDKGAANGVATLDANAKIELDQLPDTLLGNVKYGGTFDPATGVCTLVDGKILGVDGTEYNELTINTSTAANFRGYYFLATGDATLVGLDFLVGDWCISNGTSGWAKVDNTDAITGIKGNNEETYRIGQVNLTAENIGAVEANAAIEGGNFYKVTVDEKGLVTAGQTTLTTADISDLETELGNYVAASQGEGNANRVLVTDENGAVTTAVRKFVASIGDGATTEYSVQHNMGTKDVIVQISDATTYEVVYAQIEITSENVIDITFAEAPAANAYRVIVLA